MKLSIIIPTLNEKDHLEGLIQSIGQTDTIQKEIIFVDGGLEDGTREGILKLCAAYPFVKYVDNPQKYVSHGFNKAFQHAEGQYLALVGAHAIYPPGYFSECVAAIESGACEVAGGFLVHEGRTAMGKTIAIGMASRFGVGDTPFRTSRKRRYTDGVAFAVYPRRIFDAVGLFDEEMIRNQDDEFHYRIHAAGFRILLLPQLEVRYHVRERLESLWRQYFQYGYYKPLVFQKVHSGMRLRHLVPPAFALYITALPLSALAPGYLWPLALYALASMLVSVFAAKNIATMVRLPWVFGVLHLAYGFGFLKRLLASLKRST